MTQPFDIVHDSRSDVLNTVESLNRMILKESTNSAISQDNSSVQLQPSIRIPQESPVQYLNHCDNGTRELFEKFSLKKPNNLILPNQAARDNNFNFALNSLRLGQVSIRDFEHINVIDNQLLEIPESLPESLDNHPNIKNNLLEIPESLPESLDSLQDANNILLENPERPDSHQNVPDRVSEFHDNLPENFHKLLSDIVTPLNDIATGENSVPVSKKELYELARKCLCLLLQTDSLKNAIQNAKDIQTFLHPENQNDDDVPLDDDQLKTLMNAISEKITSVLKTPNACSLSDLELTIALENHEYDMSSPKDLLSLANQSAVAVAKCVQGEDGEDYATLQDCAQRLLQPEMLLAPEDTNDLQLEKLARITRAFSDIKPNLKAIIARGKDIPDLQGENNAAKTALKFLNAIEAMEIQIEATAKLSIHNKIKNAHALVVQNAWKEGRGQYFSAHLDVGPEFAILNNQARIGVHLSFTYTYALNVTNPYGSITVSNSIEAGISVQGNFGKDEDPISGGFQIDGGYHRSKIHFYSNPEELVEAESGRIFKQLMHYMKPAEIPKTQARGFKESVIAIGTGIKNFFVSSFHSIKRLFTKTSAQAAKSALLNNEVFKSKLKDLGVFHSFDTIKRASVNRAYQSNLVVQGGKVSGKGNVNFNTDLNVAGPLKEFSGSLGYKYKKSTMTVYKAVSDLLQAPIGTLENYLNSEYDLYQANNSIGTLFQEEEEFRKAKRGEVLDAASLMKKTTELIGEYKWFCELTNQDDLAKSGFSFHSPRSPERNTLMQNRKVENRGEYLRAILTRCIALKHQVLSSQKNNLLLDEEDQQVLQVVNRMLDNLGKELAAPPVVLSKSNQSWLIGKIQKTTKSSSVDLAVKAKFKPDAFSLPFAASSLGGLKNILKPANQSKVEVEAKLHIDIPHNNKKFFGKHNSATLSVSLTGDQLLQFGPQVVSSIIVAIRDKVSSDDKSAMGQVINAIVESLKDFSANIAHDLSTNELTQIVKDSISDQKVFLNGETFDMSDIISFRALHNNTFTLNFNLTGTSEGIRYGGLDITNTRGKVYSLEAHVPVHGIIGVGGSGSIATGSTTNVLSLLGADTFSPLVKSMMDIRGNKTAVKIFAQRHKKALLSMFDDCLKNGTKLHAEFSNFLNNALTTCQSYLQANGVHNQQFGQAKTLTSCIIKILHLIDMLPHSDSFKHNHSNVISNLKHVVKNLIKESLKRNDPSINNDDAEKLAEDTMNKQPEKLLSPATNNDETIAAYTILNMASTMQNMETLY